MKRTLVWTVAIVTAALARQAAAAEPELGERGRFAVSAERLFGYVHSTAGTTIGNVDVSQSTDTFTLLTSPTAGASTGYGWPRIAFDAFIGRRISLGGSLGMVQVSPDGGDSITGFLVAPRAGYAARLGSYVALWPHLGFTYAQISTTPAGGGANITVKTYALTLDAPFVLLVAPRAAVLIGPTFDLGIGGSQSIGAASTDRTVNDFGIQAGLLVLL